MNPEPKVVMKQGMEDGFNVEDSMEAEDDVTKDSLVSKEGLEEKEERNIVGKKDGDVKGVFGNESIFNCCWYKLTLLDNAADSRLRLLEQSAAVDEKMKE
nr:hypothetical protein [Tanacetum cinerariifolium]